MKGFMTTREACSPAQLDRSANWVRAAIRLGLIKAEKAGNTLLISRREIERVKADMPTISAKDMGGISACPK